MQHFGELIMLRSNINIIIIELRNEYKKDSHGQNLVDFLRWNDGNNQLYIFAHNGQRIVDYLKSTLKKNNIPVMVNRIFKFDRYYDRDAHEKDLTSFFDTRDANEIKNEVRIYLPITDVFSYNRIENCFMVIKYKVMRQYSRKPKFSIMAMVKTVFLFYAVELNNFTEFYRILKENWEYYKIKLGYEHQQLPSKSTLYRIREYIKMTNSSDLSNIFNLLTEYGVQIHINDSSNLMHYENPFTISGFNQNDYYASDLSTSDIFTFKTGSGCNINIQLLLLIN